MHASEPPDSMVHPWTSEELSKTLKTMQSKHMFKEMVFYMAPLTASMLGSVGSYMFAARVLDSLTHQVPCSPK